MHCVIIQLCFNYFLILSSFFFNDTATTEIYTLSLHDALPIPGHTPGSTTFVHGKHAFVGDTLFPGGPGRSEEHTSELQSRRDLVCRLLLEKKKKKNTAPNTSKKTTYNTTP